MTRPDSSCGRKRPAARKKTAATALLSTRPACVYQHQLSGNASFSGLNAVSSGYTDIGLCKYDPDGNILWIKQFGAALNDAGKGMSIDQHNRIYVAGSFGDSGGSPPMFETINFDGHQLTSHGEGDMFLLQLDTSGSVVWARNAGGVNSEIPTSIASDDNNVYICGDLGGTTMQFENLVVAGPGIFLSKYDSYGNILWARSAVATTPEIYRMSITVDQYEQVFATGA